MPSRRALRSMASRALAASRTLVCACMSACGTTVWVALALLFAGTGSAVLLPAVRQLALEFVGARSLREMAGQNELRAQFDERLQGALRLAQEIRLVQDDDQPPRQAEPLAERDHMCEIGPSVRDGPIAQDNP